MSASAERPRHTYREYLALEAKSDVKHEYCDGKIFATSGGSPEHGRLAAKVIQLLGQQLGGRPCATFSSDVRIRVQATGLTTYFDASVVCGGLERDVEDRDALVNPVVLVEVFLPRPRHTIGKKSSPTTGESRRSKRTCSSRKRSSGSSSLPAMPTALGRFVTSARVLRASNVSIATCRCPRSTTTR
jgi:hypothetical protein